jgi:hypothetical protein
MPIAGRCPTEWDECSLLLRTSVNFIHDDSLRSGELIYLLYQFADSITKVVGQQTSGVNIIYVGPRDVAATFGIILGGVPPGETMDTVQQEYFADVTVDFLSETSDGDRVLDLQIDEQIEDDGSIQLIGKLLGASYQPTNTFVNGLESSFREGQEAYIQKLILDRLRPNAINEIGGIEFFEGISSVGGRVDVDRDVATPQEDDGGGKSLNLVLVIGSAVSGLVVIIIACWFCRSMLKSKKARKEKKERKLYRLRKKAERKSRREAANESREEAEETVLGQDEEHDHARNFKEGNTPTSDEGSDGRTMPSSSDDGRQSTVATTLVDDDANLTHFPEDSKSLQEPKAASEETRKERPNPGSKDTSADKSAKSKKETEDVSPRSPIKRPQDQSAKSLFDVLPESPRQQAPPDESAKSLFAVLPVSPRKRVPPKPSKSMGSTESPRRCPPKPSKSMGSNESPSRSPSVPAPAEQKDASPGALSKLIEEAPEEGYKSPTKKLSGSRSVQYQLPSYKSDKPECESPVVLSKFIEEEAKSPSKKTRSVQHQSSALGLTSNKVKQGIPAPPESPQTRPKVRAGIKLPDVPAFEGKRSKKTRVTTKGSDKAGKVASAAGLSKSCHTGLTSPASKTDFLGDLLDDDDDDNDDDDDEFGDDGNDEAAPLQAAVGIKTKASKPVG